MVTRQGWPGFSGHADQFHRPAYDLGAGAGDYTAAWANQSSIRQHHHLVPGGLCCESGAFRQALRSGRDAAWVHFVDSGLGQRGYGSCVRTRPGESERLSFRVGSWRSRQLARRGEGRRRMVSRAAARVGDGNLQQRRLRRFHCRDPADCLVANAVWLADDVPVHRRPWIRLAGTLVTLIRKSGAALGPH